MINGELLNAAACGSLPSYSYQKLLLAHQRRRGRPGARNQKYRDSRRSGSRWYWSCLSFHTRLAVSWRSRLRTRLKQRILSSCIFPFGPRIVLKLYDSRSSELPHKSSAMSLSQCRLYQKIYRTRVSFSFIQHYRAPRGLGLTGRRENA
jgi:hypothetical protein